MTKKQNRIENSECITHVCVHKPSVLITTAKGLGSTHTPVATSTSSQVFVIKSIIFTNQTAKASLLVDMADFRVKQAQHKMNQEQFILPERKCTENQIGA